MILIVDDKPENIFALKKLLEVHSFDVDTALSGEEALRKVLKNSYALIILDVQMPVMDGFEVAEALSGLSKAKDIPIIFLSAANTDKKFITKGYSSGGIDYIGKPVDPDILVLKVKTFHRLYEQARELNEMQLLMRQEIDARKKAQYQQQRKTQELQSILESIPQIAFTADASGNIEFANEQWYIYSDRKDTFPAVYDNGMLVDGFWKKFLDSYIHTPLSAGVCLKKLHNAKYRYHLLSVVPVKEDNKIVKWVGTFTDIHEQKQNTNLLEKRVEERTRELTKINDHLKTSNADLLQFASVVSHDLKEPLRKIQVFSSMVVSDRYKEKLDPEIAGYLNKVIVSSKRMTKIIDDLLDFSRLSAGSLFQNTDIGQVINNIIADLEPIIRETNAIINCSSSLPCIDAEPGQVKQLFQSVISNAIKFSVTGQQPLINILAETIATKDIAGVPDENGKYCRITIADNGIGFNEKYLDKIFAIFQRLHSRDEYEGTGIGLAIAKKIAENHDGVISARSIAGQGATFIIVLPLHQGK